jgi:hypothetical protein
MRIVRSVEIMTLKMRGEKKKLQLNERSFFRT